MLFNPATLTLCLTLATCLGCEPKNVPSPAVVGGPEACHDAKSAEQRQTELKQIRRQLKQLVAGLADCRDDPSAADCQDARVNSDVDNFNWPEDVNARILILDESTNPQVSLGRYRNRVLARLQPDESEHYSVIHDSMDMASGVKRVLHDYLGSTPTFLPVEWFGRPMAKTLRQRMSSAWERLPRNHGNPILTGLAEMNPESAFLLAAAPTVPDEYLCPGDLTRARRYMERAAESLSVAVTDYNISYINWSMGATRDIIRDRWQERCVGYRPISKELADGFLQVEAIFAKRMASLYGVTLVQAGLSTSPVGASIDCATTGYPNRLRVNTLDYSGNDIPPVGAALRGFERYVPFDSQALSCNDALIVTGIDADGSNRSEAVAFIQVETMHAFVNDIVTASFVAPVALSRLIHLRNTQFPTRGRDLGLPADLIRAFTKNGTLPVQDPIFYHQFEKYRLGLCETAEDEEPDL